MRVNARLKVLIRKKSDELPRFLSAISWTGDTELRMEIRSLVSSSKDAAIVASGAVAFADSADISCHDEVVRLFQRWKTDKSDTECAAAGTLLRVALTTWPDHSQETLTAYFAKASRPAIEAGLMVCYELKGIPVEPLRRLLDDKGRSFGYYLKDGPGVHEQPQEKDYRPYRICDHAYQLICHSLGDEMVTCVGEPAAMNGIIALLKARLTGDPAAWRFSAAEIASRQATQNIAASDRSILLEKIRKAETDPARQAVMILETNGTNLDDWQKAAAVLYGLGFGKAEPEYRNIAINRDNKGKRKFDTLDSDWQKRAVTIMATRCRALGDSKTKGSYPFYDEANFFSIACMRLPEANRELQAEYLAMLEAALVKNGFPKGDQLESVIQIADDLIGFGTPGATEWFAKLAAKATPKFLDRGMSATQFFSVIAHHSALPDMQKAAEVLFLRPDSPWNPAKLSYADADDLGSALPLRIPAFRRALVAALRDNPKRIAVVGHLSISKHDPESCEIDWAGNKGSSSMGVGKPCGAKQGGPPMDVRQVGTLLESIANNISMDEQKEQLPEFQIYWPQEKRDQAIAQWIEHLEGK